MQSITDKNKEVVTRFNREIIEKGNIDVFSELVADHIINHSAAPGMSKGGDGMVHFLKNILRAGFPDLRVEIEDQVAEGDKVTTRKTIYGTHKGEFMGIAPTGKPVAIHIIDIIRLEDGKYIEHWGASNLAAVAAELSA